MTLLDTGSGTNLLERKYVHPRDLRPSQQSIRAANGTKIRIVGEAPVSMQIGVRTYRVPVLVTVLGQNGSGQNGTEKMVCKKWYTDKMVLDKMVRTKWYGQNGTDKI